MPTKDSYFIDLTLQREAAQMLNELWQKSFGKYLMKQSNLQTILLMHVVAS